MEQWKSWMDNNDQSMVDSGGPLGKTKLITASGITDTKNTITGYSIVKADSLVEAAKIFENHPHFKMIGDGSVEVIEFVTMLEM